MWINREAESLLKQRVSTRPAVVLTGARQTGKTALARRLFPDFHYVSLDLPSAAAEAETSPEAFLERHPTPLIIDEVQYAPAIFRHLKTVIDGDRAQNGQFLLTGSQPFSLMQGVADSLAGRVAIVHLEGLTWAEARQALPNVRIEELIWRGGFPELYANPNIDPQQFHADYIATYLERDLRNVLAVTNLRDFDRFLRACGGRTGGLLNLADLGRDIGITGPTAKQWLSALERSSQVALLEPWYTSHIKGLTKSPKLFIGDSGTACFLTGHRSPEALLSSPLRGALWETAVFAELRRVQLNRLGRWDLQFFRNRSREVDFLQQVAGRLHLADAKWSEQPSERDLKQLKAAASAIGEDQVGSLSLLCRAPNSHPIGSGASEVKAYAAWDIGDWARIT